MPRSPGRSEETVIVVDGQEEKDFPDPFPFPLHYQPEIELGLKIGRLEPKLHAKLVTRVANAMFLYKR